MYQYSCNGFLFHPIHSIYLTPYQMTLISPTTHLHSICYPCCCRGGIKKAKGKLIHLILSTPCGRVWHECFLIHCVWLTRNRGLLWMTLFPFAHYCHQPPTHCDSYTKGWAWQLVFYSGTPFVSVYPAIFIHPLIVGFYGYLLSHGSITSVSRMTWDTNRYRICFMPCDGIFIIIFIECILTFVYICLW